MNRNGKARLQESPINANSLVDVITEATSSQIKAIGAIAQSQKLDVSQFLRERFGRERPEDLTVKEASSAIDDLKRR